MPNGQSSIETVITQIPSGLFVLTTAHDGMRSGVMARWVQRCSVDPPMVMVAIPKGQAVEPLILDSRSFALCQIHQDDRLVLRKFDEELDRAHDPFDAISTSDAPTGSPLIDRAVSFLDCEVIRHVELESDHRVYVGQVHTGALLAGASQNSNGQVG
ncbi:MAG: flavin reductase family protein [Planctomycetota bacterium]|jgi:flavin reductase (DIM6/NTAB) family NADH-FMN oxidoreductase RutF